MQSCLQQKYIKNVGRKSEWHALVCEKNKLLIKKLIIIKIKNNYKKNKET